MDPREQRGLVIAATCKLTQKGKVWLVPSQSGKGKYTVSPDPDAPFCSCPDHEEHGGWCKHLYAAKIVIERDQGRDGVVTETRTLTLTQKKTYKQDWPVYNLAQTTEKNRIQVLLRDLCQGIEDPPQPKSGRRRTAMKDMVFASCFKVYCGLSSRRFGCDLDAAHENGFVSHKLHPGMTWAFLESELMTPVLMELVAESAAPLRSVETDFAVDSSGFSTSRFVKWFDEKYGAMRSGHDWVKVHVCTGVKTNVVTAVEILGRDAADAPQFGGLVKATAERFTINEVSGDKAYLSKENVETVYGLGGTPYIAFKSNSTGGSGGLFAKMYHHYAANKEAYMGHYHKRSNVESTFSMVKAKFGDGVRSKGPVSMKNEVLCKILLHNLCCLVMSQCELGIEPTFWKDEAPTVVTPAIEAVVETASVLPPALCRTPVAPSVVAPVQSERRFASVGTMCGA